MKIIYIHHAERDISLGQSQDNDITRNGVNFAEMMSEFYKDKKITAIYTSPYKRCMRTAQIINRHNKTNVITDARFNEKQENESWKQLQQRNMTAINDIVNTYDDNDVIICITSGINLSAFINYFNNIKADNNNPWIQGGICSVVNFEYNKNSNK